MIMVNCFVCFVLFCVSDLVQSQSDYQVHTHPVQHQIIKNNNLYHLPTPHRYVQKFHPVSNQQQIGFNSKEAEDRHIHWIKYLKKKKKKKLKLFKQHFKKCGFPFKFKLIKKSDDDDLDTVKIKLPYGFGEEYYPRVDRKSDTLGNNSVADDEDDDDEDYDDDDDEPPDDSAKINTVMSSPQSLQKYPPYFLRHNVMLKPRPLPPPPMMMHPIPPFKPIRGPIPKILFPRLIPRPWINPTPWRLARPGFPPHQFNLREPIPGIFRGSPPVNPIIQDISKDQLMIPVNTSKITTQTTTLMPIITQPNNYLLQSYPRYTVRYSQPDYSMYGSYQIPTPATIPTDQGAAEEENVVTVTPSSIWVNSPIFQLNQNSSVKSRSIDYKTHQNNHWMPTTQINNSSFRIIVGDEPEIITSKYTLEEINNNSHKPNIITKENMGTLEEHERYVNYRIAPKSNGTYETIPGSNTSRIRRSKIESVSTVVSRSITVKD